MGFTLSPIGAVGTTPQLGGSGLAFVRSVAFSSAATVSLDNVFTANFDNYRVVATGSNSTGADLQIRLRALAADNSSSTYSYARNYFGFAAASTNNIYSATGTYFLIGGWSTDFSAYAIDVFRPQASSFTGLSTIGFQATFREITSGVFGATTQFDGLTLYPSAGTMTGTVTVFGYRKA